VSIIAAEAEEKRRRQAQAEKLTAETQETANLLGDASFGQQPKQLDLAELKYSDANKELTDKQVEGWKWQFKAANDRAKAEDARYAELAKNTKTSGHRAGLNATGAFTGAGSFDKPKCASRTADRRD
jgi:hypothetical protein